MFVTWLLCLGLLEILSTKESKAILKKITIVLISLIYWSLSELKQLILRLFGRPYSGRMVVLYYHGVPAIARSHFARQMDILARKAIPVPADYDGPLRPGRLHVAITFDDGFASFLNNALPEISTRRLPVTVFVPAGVLGRNPTWEFNEEINDRTELIMTEDEISRLPNRLVTIGSHSMTHPDLPCLSEAELTIEVEKSRALLKDVTGHCVDLFSFPYGRHDARVVNACRKAGYKHAFSILPVPVKPQDGEFVRGRVAIDLDDSDFIFMLKVSGAYSWRPFAFALKSKLFSKRFISTATSRRQDQISARSIIPSRMRKWE